MCAQWAASSEQKGENIISQQIAFDLIFWFWMQKVHCASHLC
jgi:hypothetical protein